jgi:hypothetical protein
MPKTQITVNLDPDLLARVEQAAADGRRSRSDTIVGLILKGLAAGAPRKVYLLHDPDADDYLLVDVFDTAEKAEAERVRLDHAYRGNGFTLQVAECEVQ